MVHGAILSHPVKKFTRVSAKAREGGGSIIKVTGKFFEDLEKNPKRYKWRIWPVFFELKSRKTLRPGKATLYV